MTSASFDECQRTPDALSTYGMRDCIRAEQRRLRRRIDAAYRQAMARLSNPSARAHLATLEQSWLATWSRECRRRYAHAEGTISLVAEDACGMMELARRLAWLEHYGRRP